jgi:nucleotide-binding universal stress UspA family protein
MLKIAVTSFVVLAMVPVILRLISYFYSALCFNLRVSTDMWLEKQGLAHPLRAHEDSNVKNILLLVHDDIGQESRFQAAVDVTRALNGHLKCLEVVSLIPWPIDAAEGASIQLNFQRKMETKNKNNLLNKLAVEGVSWEWIDTTGSISLSIMRELKLIDLIVVNRRLDDYPIPDMDRVVGELVVKSKLPILAVPENTRGVKVAGAALIAWDGSPAVSTALAAAVPLLRLAKTVSLLEVDDGSIQAPATEAAIYLSRHDIKADIIVEDFQLNDAPSLLLAHARSGKFNYVVMGGFGHSRFVEAIFGGVTRLMLDNSPVALFMAH